MNVVVVLDLVLEFRTMVLVSCCCFLLMVVFRFKPYGIVDGFKSFTGFVMDNNNGLFMIP